MRRQSWFRFSAMALTLLALLGTIAAALPSQGANAFQAAAASPVATATGEATGGAVAVDQVFVSERWRIEMIFAREAVSFPDFKLTKNEGKDWIVAVADVTNWSSKTGALDPTQFGIRAAGATDVVPLAPSSTARLAKQLSLQPADAGRSMSIDSGKSARLALAFSVDAAGIDPSLVYGGSSAPLANALTNGRSIDALPSADPAPELTAASYAGAVSGSVVKLTKSGTIALAGVDAPVANECFAGEATARVSKLAKGKKLLLETTPSRERFLWIEQDDGSRLLLNVSLVNGGYAAAAHVDGAYVSWINAAEASARAADDGLWAACTNQHGETRSAKPEVTQLTAKSDGKVQSYVAWIAYPPKIVTTPDGGAWAFYSAQPKSGNDKDGERLFASHYDPSKAMWTTGTAFPGGKYQMGASAAVDSKGRVHLVYSDQADGGSYAVLMYTHEDGSGGWTAPAEVATDANAGHQLYPSLAIDKHDVLHVAWQDQRSFSDSARTVSASNADVFVSDLKVGDASWSTPFLVDTHYFDAASLLPHLVVDNDRLVLVWSVYVQATGLSTAARVDWATRPIDKALGWTLGQPLIAGRGDGLGGRLIDMAADPTGGVVLVFARQANDSFVFLRRLKPDAIEWGGDILIAYGARGNFPSVAVAQNGTVYVVYEASTAKLVKVAAVAIPYRSVVPGPEVVLTTKEGNSQGRAVVSTDLTSQPWIVYITEPSGGSENKVEVLRNAAIPAVAQTKK